MNRQDDNALSMDPSAIDILIDGAAPEKAQAWRDLVRRYQISFHPISDRKGVTIRARGRRIEFDPKTMAWFWLLGFGGWRAFRLHAPHLIWRKLTGASIDAKLRSSDPTFAEAEGDYEAILYAVRDFPRLETLDDADWPDHVPRQQTDKEGFDKEQQGAFDLTMIATAYALLHEVRHVIFNVDGGRPSDPEEELACDAYARAFLLDGVGDYATRSGEPREDVLAKRAAGVALGAFIIYGFTPEEGRGGTADYPPIADRLDALFPDVPLSADHWFWNYAASLLVASIVSRDRAATIPDLTGRGLCRELVAKIRTWHQA